MRLKHLHGDVAFNNGLVLEDGRVSIAYPGDGEDGNPALRLHDGETPGGWEAVADGRAVSTGPGPQTLQAGDYQAGFYGEVPTDDLINGDDLASEIGLSTGTIHNTDSPWLKFASDDKTLFVAKQTYRYDLSWDAINAVNAVYGDTEVTIGTNTYRVRLLTGGDADPASEAGGEWNALFYPIHEDDPNNQGWGVNYTDAELNVGTGDGRGTWVQETVADDSGRRVLRGYSPVEYFGTYSSSYVYSFLGWRPVLELIG